MDACFLSVCLQLVKKPPGFKVIHMLLLATGEFINRVKTLHNTLARQFVYVTSEELATIETDS